MNGVRLVDFMQAVTEDVTALKGERDAANKKVESLQMALASLKEDQERLKVACLASPCIFQLTLSCTSFAILWQSTLQGVCAELLRCERTAP